MKHAWLVVMAVGIAACSHQDAGETTQATPAPAEPVAAATAAAPDKAPPPAPLPVAVAPAATVAQAEPAPTAPPAPQPPPPDEAPAPPPARDQSMPSDQAQLAGAGEAALLPAQAPPGTPSSAKKPNKFAAMPYVAHPTATAATHLSATTAIQHAAAQPTHFAQLAAKFREPAAMSLPPGTQHTMSLRIGDVGISNLDSAMRVSFAMKSPDQAWTNQALDANDTREFGCGGLSADQLDMECLFWMQTGNKPAVYYRIKSNARYAIFWDDSQALWDLQAAH